MNLFEELSKNYLKELAIEVKQKIAEKNKPDGEWCLYCNNFFPMAVKNFEQGLLCWSCNVYRNRIICGIE